jgi:predicted RND superfamily exporter protein
MFAELRAKADDDGRGAAAPAALKNTDAQGYLTAGSDDVLLLAVFARLDDATAATYERVVDGLRDHRDAALRELDAPGVQVRLTGIPALTIDENLLVAQGMRDSGIATFVAVFLVLLVAYWSLRQAIFALLPLGLGMGIAVGAITLVVGSLNTITSAMFAMLLGLGIDFSVHLLARYQEVSKELPGEPTEALRRAFAQAGPGVVTGALTTIVAFLALLGAEFTTFAELGLNTAIGLTILLVVTVVVLPPLQTLRRRAPRVSGGVTGLRFLHRIVKRGAGLIVVLAIATTGFGVWAAMHVGFNARYFDFLPQRVESAVALDVLERSGGLSPIIAYAVAEDLEGARRLTEALRALEPVGDVQSPTDLLPPLDDARKRDLTAAFDGLTRDPDFDRLRTRSDHDPKLASARARAVADLLGETIFALEQGGRDTVAATAARDAFRGLEQRLTRLADGGGGAAAIARVEVGFGELLARAWRVARAVERRGAYAFEDIPPVFRHRHRAIVDTDTGVALFVSPKHRIWDLGEAKRFADAVEGVAPAAAGHAINMHVHNQMIMRDFRQAALLATLLVTILVFVDFRRLDETLLALVPVLMGLSWTFAMMWSTGAMLNAANIVVLPLIIGIGVDAGVHVMHRWHQSAAEHGGVAVMKDIVEGTGGAVMIASITTMLGFAGMLIPDHGGIRSLGYIMVIGVGCSLLVTIVVLPALLVLLRRIR